MMITALSSSLQVHAYYCMSADAIHVPVRLLDMCLSTVIDALATRALSHAKQCSRCLVRTATLRTYL